jgi:hypothetical protein
MPSVEKYGQYTAPNLSTGFMATWSAVYPSAVKRVRSQPVAPAKGWTWSGVTASMPGAARIRALTASRNWASQVLVGVSVAWRIEIGEHEENRSRGPC